MHGSVFTETPGPPGPTKAPPHSLTGKLESLITCLWSTVQPFMLSQGNGQMKTVERWYLSSVSKVKPDTNTFILLSCKIQMFHIQIIVCVWSALGVTRQTILKLKTESEAYMYSTNIQQQVLQQVSRRVISVCTWSKSTIVWCFPILFILSSCITT